MFAQNDPARLDGNVGNPTNSRRKQAKHTPPRRGRRKNEIGGEGRGKEAGPALNPLKGSSAFLPSDAVPCRTPRTKLNLLKTNALLIARRVKNPSPLPKFPSPRRNARTRARPAPRCIIIYLRCLTPPRTTCYVESLPWTHFRH